jgi:hypothetical protein
MLHSFEDAHPSHEAHVEMQLEWHDVAVNWQFIRQPLLLQLLLQVVSCELHTALHEKALLTHVWFDMHGPESPLDASLDPSSPPSLDPPSVTMNAPKSCVHATVANANATVIAVAFLTTCLRLQSTPARP